MKEHECKSDAIQLLELVTGIGGQSSQKLANEPLHLLQNIIITTADICAANLNLKEYQKVSKSSVTYAVPALDLRAVSLRYRLDLDRGRLHVSYLEDFSRAVRKQLELAEFHQVSLRQSTKEDLPSSREESTLHSHLMNNDFASSIYGSVQFEGILQAEPAVFSTDRELESHLWLF